MSQLELLKQIIREEIEKALSNNVDAIFIGWQENVPGKPSIALYDVTKKGHPLHGSTVSITTLKKNNLKFNPPPEETK